MVYSHRPYRPACLTRRAMTTPTSRPVSRDPWQTRGGEEAGGWNGDPARAFGENKEAIDDGDGTPGASGSMGAPGGPFHAERDVWEPGVCR